MEPPLRLKTARECDRRDLTRTVALTDQEPTARPDNGRTRRSPLFLGWPVTMIGSFEVLNRDLPSRLGRLAADPVTLVCLLPGCRRLG